jgi:predicted DCC family thiol-disulfide oxidoreductase YuxK
MTEKIILFDGVCNLCNTLVKFIIKHDPGAQLRFTHLQSPFAKKIFEKLNIPAEKFDSLVFVEGEKVYFRSTAAFKISRNLHGLWPVFYPLIFIPRPVRDFFYTLIAKNRYRLFGKKNSCMIPSGEINDRFLL